MGYSTAIELARKGKSVIIFEKDVPGRHASGNNSSGVRCHGRDIREIPIALEATIGKSEVLIHTSGPKINPASGAPHENNWTFFDHSSGNFKGGIWDCTARSWEHNHPNLEFCYIVEWIVKIVEKYAKKLFVSALHLEGEYVLTDLLDLPSQAG